jgi:hypothetical protein
MHMRRVLAATAAICCLGGALGALALARPAGSGTTDLGPFHGSAIQIVGTCGNVWGTASATTRYNVYPPNRDGSVTAVQTVDATLVTLAGASPGACNGGPDNGSTIAAGVRVRLHALQMETIRGGTFNPHATCAAQCFTGAFVPAFFGPAATVDNNTEFEDWTTSCNGRYVVSGSPGGRNAGDITGTLQHHCN